MERKIISKRISQIIDEVARLKNSLYALDNTDIEKYQDNYEMLSTDAALRGELIACRLRHLLYGSTTIKKQEYLCSAGIVQGIDIRSAEGILEITLPCLLPKRRQRQSTEFLIDPVYFTLSQYADRHELPKFRHCVVCFSHIYNQDLPLRRVRDYDNLELKQLLDVISTFVMADDTLASQFVPILDEIYKLASLTSKLDGNPDLVRAGANANELVIPKLSMQGLGDYSRNSGYVTGDVTLTNETVSCNFDRGRMFNVDVMDNIETAGIAFGRLAGEFIRTKVVPELDAFRFATYCGISGISTTAAAVLSAGADVIAALRAATNKMDEDEVGYEERHLFITPTLMGLVQDLDTTKSKEVLSRFASTTLVPQTRFYTAIDQYDGTTSGEAAGGYIKDATSGKNINFMVLHKPALIQFEKHVAPKIIEPAQNQTADGYKFGYRNVGIADVYENKVAGVYCHKSTS